MSTTSHFFSPNLHAPCTPSFRFYFFFVIGFNFIGLFNLSLLDFCTCYFSFTSCMYLHCLISTYPNYVCLLFVSISIYFFVFHFEFYVVVNVLFGITAYGNLITQYGLLHHLFGLLESLVSLTFNLPLFFLSMFQYHC